MKTIGQNDQLRISFVDSKLSYQEVEKMKVRTEDAQKRLISNGEVFTGWVDLPETYDKEEIRRIKSVAKDIRKKCDAFVVIGIGGSYLGARAAIEMLEGDKSCPDIYFAGQNISAVYHAHLLEQLKGKEVCICIISKSGTTTEPAIAFSLLKDMMVQKYGRNGVSRRIYAITDRETGIIREAADKEGYESFVIPNDIGGRYSVLTAVGLLPMAVRGIDIDRMLLGAGNIAKPKEFEADGAAQYAAVRNLLFDKGKYIEIFESYEPGFFYFSEWLKQLFGESEGKQGKGIFPASLQFSTDLHSMGQFLQEGNQIFFETIINVEEPNCDLAIPDSAGGALANLSMNDVNNAAFLGVMEAHRKVNIPMIRIDIPAFTPYYFGQMVYFFERACALSGYLSDVNPFDQPGVEEYKSEMRKVLKRKG